MQLWAQEDEDRIVFVVLATDRRSYLNTHSDYIPSHNAPRLHKQTAPAMPISHILSVAPQYLVVDCLSVCECSVCSKNSFLLLSISTYSSLARYLPFEHNGC